MTTMFNKEWEKLIVERVNTTSHRFAYDNEIGIYLFASNNEHLNLFKRNQ
jgi:hypothetical protein